jgi:hypothetical protein
MKSPETHDYATCAEKFIKWRFLGQILVDALVKYYEVEK